MQVTSLLTVLCLLAGCVRTSHAEHVNEALLNLLPNLTNTLNMISAECNPNNTTLDLLQNLANILNTTLVECKSHTTTTELPTTTTVPPTTTTIPPTTTTVPPTTTTVPPTTTIVPPTTTTVPPTTTTVPPTTTTVPPITTTVPPTTTTLPPTTTTVPPTTTTVPPTTTTLPPTATTVPPTTTTVPPTTITVPPTTTTVPPTTTTVPPTTTTVLPTTTTVPPTTTTVPPTTTTVPPTTTTVPPTTTTLPPTTTTVPPTTTTLPPTTTTVPPTTTTVPPTTTTVPPTTTTVPPTTTTVPPTTTTVPPTITTVPPTTTTVPPTTTTVLPTTTVPPTTTTVPPTTTTVPPTTTTTAIPTFTPRTFIFFLTPSKYTVLAFCDSRSSSKELAFKFRTKLPGQSPYGRRLAPDPTSNQQRKYCNGQQLNTGLIVSVNFTATSPAIIYNYQLDMECMADGQLKITITKDSMVQAIFEQPAKECGGSPTTDRRFKWTLPVENTMLDVHCLSSTSVSAQSGTAAGASLTSLTYVDGACNTNADNSNDCYCHGKNFQTALVNAGYTYKYLHNWKWGANNKYVANIACIYPNGTSTSAGPNRAKYVLKKSGSFAAGVEYDDEACTNDGLRAL